MEKKKKKLIPIIVDVKWNRILTFCYGWDLNFESEAWRLFAFRNIEFRLDVVKVVLLLYSQFLISLSC